MVSLEATLTQRTLRARRATAMWDTQLYTAECWQAGLPLLRVLTAPLLPAVAAWCTAALRRLVIAVNQQPGMETWGERQGGDGTVSCGLLTSSSPAHFPPLPFAWEPEKVSSLELWFGLVSSSSIAGSADGD